MSEGSLSKWYDNKVVVGLLLFFLFPLGMYALFKSRTISDRWKFIIGSVVSALVLISVAVDQSASGGSFFIALIMLVTGPAIAWEARGRAPQKKLLESPELVAVSRLILADNRVEQHEAEALLDMLDRLPASSMTSLHVQLHDATRRALADGTLDENEAEEIRVLLGEVLDRTAPEKREPLPGNARQRAPRPVKQRSSPKQRPAPTLPKASYNAPSLEPGMEVVMNYMDASGDISEREVVVRNIECKGGRHYVAGICQMRRAYRTFRADRIIDLTIKDTGEYIDDVAAAIR